MTMEELEALYSKHEELARQWGQAKLTLNESARPERSDDEYETASRHERSAWEELDRSRREILFAQERLRRERSD